MLLMEVKAHLAPSRSSLDKALELFFIQKKLTTPIKNVTLVRQEAQMACAQLTCKEE